MLVLPINMRLQCFALLLLATLCLADDEISQRLLVLRTLIYGTHLSFWDRTLFTRSSVFHLEGLPLSKSVYETDASGLSIAQKKSNAGSEPDGKSRMLTLCHLCEANVC